MTPRRSLFFSLLFATLLLWTGCSCSEDSRIAIQNVGEVVTLTLDGSAFTLLENESARIDVERGTHTLASGDVAQTLSVGECEEVSVTVEKSGSDVSFQVLGDRDLDD